MAVKDINKLAGQRWKALPERTKQDVKAHVKQLQELYYDKLDALAAAGDRPDHGRAAPWSVGGRVWIQLEREPTPWPRAHDDDDDDEDHDEKSTTQSTPSAPKAKGKVGSAPGASSIRPL